MRGRPRKKCTHFLILPPSPEDPGGGPEENEPMLSSETDIRDAKASQFWDGAECEPIHTACAAEILKSVLSILFLPHCPR